MANPPDSISNIVAYWQAGKPYEESSSISRRTQRELYIAGGFGHLALLRGVFASHNMEYGGVSSYFPSPFSLGQGRLLRSRNLSVVSATYSATVVQRNSMRQALRTCDTNGIGGEFGVDYATSHEAAVNAGKLIIAEDDTTVPEDILGILEKGGVPFADSATAALR